MPMLEHIGRDDVTERELYLVDALLGDLVHAFQRVP